MTVAEYLAWYDEQPEGHRYELHEGVPVRMQSERVTHSETKLATRDALRSGIRAAGHACHVVVDGPQVIIPPGHTAYEPDVIVYCGPKIVDDRVHVPDPVIIVEVTSPSTALKDSGDKLRDYFALPSVAHYIRVIRESRLVLHHARGLEGHISVRICQPGDTIALDPPGITVAAGAMLELVD